MLNESAASQDQPVRPRLLDRRRDAILTLHSSRRTEEAYGYRTKRFIYFRSKRHPSELGEAEVTAFLNHPGSQRNVSASTQNQALAALLFLYKNVIGVDLPWLDGLARARRPERLPVVLAREEVEKLLACLEGAN